MPTYDYDLITLGAGSGGVRASRMAARAGARVAIAESSRHGGTCVIRGCVPKKLLVYGAEFAEAFADAPAYGWSVEQVRFDWSALHEAKNAEVNRLQGIYQRLLREAGVTMLDGHAHLVDDHTVEVGGTRYTAETILVATGGRPQLPDIPGIEHAMTSDDALEMESLPGRVAVVGGGYIAVEFAGIFNALGAEVTQILRGDTILRGFDQDLRTTLAGELAKKGVTIRCETRVRSIEKLEDGRLSLRFAMGETLTVDRVLYATGRRPNTDGLGLDKAGVTLSETGGIPVDAHSRTNVPNIYAVGDVTERMALTPVAIEEAMAFVDTVFKDQPRAMDYANVPTAVFSHPPIGTVGLTEAEARQRCDAVDIYAADFRPMKHTLTQRDERTLTKLVVDRPSQRVMGLHMMGEDAPEITQGFAVALKAGATKATFDATVGIHPTAAEEFVTMREPRPDPAAGEEE